MQIYLFEGDLSNRVFLNIALLLDVLQIAEDLTQLQALSIDTNTTESLLFINQYT